MQSICQYFYQFYDFIAFVFVGIVLREVYQKSLNCVKQSRRYTDKFSMTKNPRSN